jgi:hypothetical protein
MADEKQRMRGGIWLRIKFVRGRRREADPVGARAWGWRAAQCGHRAPVGVAPTRTWRKANRHGPGPARAYWSRSVTGARAWIGHIIGARAMASPGIVHQWAWRRRDSVKRIISAYPARVSLFAKGVALCSTSVRAQKGQSLVTAVLTVQRCQGSRGVVGTVVQARACPGHRDGGRVVGVDAGVKPATSLVLKD